MNIAMKIGIIFSLIINTACTNLFIDAMNDVNNVNINFVNLPVCYETGNIAIKVSIRESGAYKYKLYKYNDATEPEWSAPQGLSDTITPAEEGYYILKVIANKTDGTWMDDSSAARTNFGYGTGVGTDEFPMCISTLTGLQDIPDGSGLTYVLNNDIDASITNDGGSGFDPICYCELLQPGTPFSGKFYGLNHIISNLYINRPGTDFIGLFACLEGAEIYDLGLVDINITGWRKVGGLTGQSVGFSTIISSYSTGNVYGVNEIGGLSGRNFSSTITSSYSTCDVNGADYAIGGLVGWNEQSSKVISSYSTGNVIGGGNAIGGLIGLNLDSSEIESSYSTGNVYGDDTVGGLAGSLSNSSTITSCYSRGNVYGNDSVGGLVGSAFLSADNVLKWSYSTGIVTGAGSNLGGFLGTYNPGTIEYCYWNSTGQETLFDVGAIGDDANISAVSSDQMKLQSTYSEPSWDFSGTWAIDPSINNGYPYLLWQVE